MPSRCSGARDPRRSLAYPASVTTSHTRDLLAWIDQGPRTYEETLDVWKTSCPHLAVWDDAVVDGLVRVEREAASSARVRLTEAGRAFLEHV
jgi:hypothetical protein